MNIEDLISKYKLQKHPEGGYFAEAYRSEQTVCSPVNAQKRSAVTDIYFLLIEGQISRFHKVLHDEIWHFYEGAPLQLLKFDGDLVQDYTIGLGCTDGYKVVIEGGSYQAAVPRGKYSLVGCTVAPGFDFADFSFLADAPENLDFLINKYPQYKKLV